MVEPLRKIVSRFLRKLKIELPYDPAIPLLGIYPDKTVIQKDTCTPMFIAALLTLAKTRSQLKRPPTIVDTADVAHTCSGILFSHKRKETMPFAATCMQLEMIILSMSEREKQIPCDTTYMWNLKYDTDELVYKTDPESGTWRTD